MDDFVQFSWVLQNPSALLEAETATASFFIEYPTLTRWTVEIQPFPRRFMNREYRCSVYIDARFENVEVTVEKLAMSVMLNAEKPVKEISVIDFTFSRGRSYFFTFDLEIAECVELQPNILSIETNIKIRREGNDAARLVRNEVEMPLLWGGKPEDLIDLMSKMDDCQASRKYPSMLINGIGVHHYILQKRWTNLFEIHGLDHNSLSLDLEISEPALLFILRYMYTSWVRTNWALLEGAPNMIEVFQVIFRYRIFHMYRAFMQSRSILMLKSGNHALALNKIIKLHMVAVPHLIDHSVIFPIDPAIPVVDSDEHGPHKVVNYFHTEITPGAPGANLFQFSVRVKWEHKVGFWLSYSFESQAQTKFKIQVSLQMMIEGTRKFVHCSDFYIPEYGSADSGPVLFMGCRYTFGSASGTAEDAQQSDPPQSCWDLDFNIKLCDGSSVFQYFVCPVPNQDYWVPAEDLSSHMCDVFREQFCTDLVVQLRGDLEDERSFYRFHKAIFTKRIPKWREVIEPPIVSPNLLTDTTSLPLRHESFHFIASYIYTGKLMEVPVTLRQEIVDFANNSGFFSLQNLMRQHFWDY